MAPGDLHADPDVDGLQYVDTGMYDVAEYGSVYLLDADRPAVVDTGIGADRERVFEALEAVGIAQEDLEAILLTHVHLDHAGGAGYLVEACPNVTVYAHERAVPHLVDPARLVEGTKRVVGDQWTHYADPVPVPDDRITALGDGDTVDLGDRTVDVVAAPGHAPHQVVFHDRASDVLFTGDAAGIYTPSTGVVHPTSPPPQFRLEVALDDARRIEAREPERLAYAHFGTRPFEASVLAGYRRTLVEWVEAVREARADLADDDAVVEHFADNARGADVWTAQKASAESRLNAAGVLTYLDHVTEADEG
jgi:glyoxylase-like metal-dependent hydrolase (beta-lactamase superfamily II)